MYTTPITDVMTVNSFRLSLLPANDAVKNAVQEAAKVVNTIQSVYVKETNAKVENGSIVSYGANAKVSFKIGG